MPVERQLSIFLENKPGVLARLCDSFAEHGINIEAMSVSDTVDHAVIRLIVSKPEHALHLLEEHGVLVVENDVLALSLSNKPGALGRMAEKLSKARVNIEYLYGTAGTDKRRSLLVVRVDNIKKAARVLGIKT